MDDFQRELLARLPLAQGVLELFSQVFSRPFLEELFEAHRGRCYQRSLSFGQMVYLIRDTLLVHEGSAQQAFERAQEAGALPVAINNAYGKLSRLPAELSMAFVREGTARLVELMPPVASSSSPASLAALALVAVDGKKLKRAAKRLKLLRGLPGKLLAAKLLVGLDLRTKLVLAMNVNEDGEANEVPLVPQLLPQVRVKAQQPVLWVADRQFCDLNLPRLFAQGDDHFLVRWSKKLGFEPDPQRTAREGIDSRGRKFQEQWGWIGSVKDARRRYLRRITLWRQGEEEVCLLTDLLDEQVYPAVDLLEVYRMRWGIENVFQQVTEVFALQKLIGSTPRGAIFQAAFCLLLYNIVQVMAAYAAQAGKRPAAEVSTEKLFYDVHQQLVSWAAAGEPAHAIESLSGAGSAEQLRQRLIAGMQRSWTRRWIKSRNKKPRKPPNKAKQSGAHTSVWRALQTNRKDRQELLRS